MPSSNGLTGDIDNRLKLAFFLELARGASHIASTLTVETRATAIADTFKDFIRDRGESNVREFGELLARSLEERDCNDGAEAVRAYVASGGRPVAEPPASRTTAARRKSASPPRRSKRTSGAQSSMCGT